MRQTVTPHDCRVLSPRDWTNVARQFIAWNPPNPRPSRRERYASGPRFCSPRRTTRRHIEPNHIVSTRRATFSDTFQAINCLARSEEHTSELQSHSDLVCRLLLEKKKKKRRTSSFTPNH